MENNYSSDLDNSFSLGAYLREKQMKSLGESVSLLQEGLAYKPEKMVQADIPEYGLGQDFEKIVALTFVAPKDFETFDVKGKPKKLTGDKIDTYVPVFEADFIRANLSEGVKEDTSYVVSLIDTKAPVKYGNEQVTLPVKESDIIVSIPLVDTKNTPEYIVLSGVKENHYNEKPVDMPSIMPVSGLEKVISAKDLSDEKGLGKLVGADKKEDESSKVKYGVDEQDFDKFKGAMKEVKGGDDYNGIFEMPKSSPIDKYGVKEELVGELKPEFGDKYKMMSTGFVDDKYGKFELAMDDSKLKTPDVFSGDWKVASKPELSEGKYML